MICLTTLFNPSKYQSLIDNYKTFSSSLKKQGAELITLELAFGNDEHVLDGVKLRSNSVMWQKERLINYGISLSKSNYAWLDADVIFKDNDWIQKAEDLLKRYHVIQLFKRVFYLPQGDSCYAGKQHCEFPSLAWQADKYPDWLKRRLAKGLPFASPGFAWAARKSALDYIYDKDVIGSGDCLFVDCLFGSWKLHGFDRKFNDKTKESVAKWCKSLKKLSVGYLPVDIFHLWHGDLRNRGYARRHQILLKHDYDPENDIKLVNNVWEWASDKLAMHEDVRNYFNDRKD